MKTIIVTAAILLGAVSGLQAQSSSAPLDIDAVATVPFGPGERLDYRITYGILGKRGNASTEILSVTDVRGNPTYHLSFKMKGGALGFSLNDVQESWLDVGELYSHRFKQDLNQTTYERLRTLDFYPAERLWRRVEKVDSGALASDMPLDEVSFLYWSRTLPFEVGKTYEFRRYFKEDGNPVVLKVLRRETITVPAGTFNTIVVRPIIQTSGLFSDGGQAEVYYTDDAQRLIVLVKTKMSIGTMQLQLEKYTPGEKLIASSRP